MDEGENWERTIQRACHTSKKWPFEKAHSEEGPGCPAQQTWKGFWTETSTTGRSKLRTAARFLENKAQNKKVLPFSPCTEPWARTKQELKPHFHDKETAFTALRNGGRGQLRSQAQCQAHWLHRQAML